MTQEIVISIPADLDISAAPELRQRILDGIEAKREVLRLDIEGEMPTQVALQLLFATQRHVRDKGIRVEFGQNAQDVLGMTD